MQSFLRETKKLCKGTQSFPEDCKKCESKHKSLEGVRKSFESERKSLENERKSLESERKSRRWYTVT